MYALSINWVGRILCKEREEKAVYMSHIYVTKLNIPGSWNKFIINWLKLKIKLVI